MNHRRKYETAADITKAFIADGWNKDTKLYGIRFIGKDYWPNDWHKKVLYIQAVTGNIYDNHGRVVTYNIPTIDQKENGQFKAMPELRINQYWGEDNFEIIDRPC